MAHKVVLTWQAPATGTVASYDVKRAPVTGGVIGAFASIANPEPTTTTYEDDGPFTEGAVLAYEVASVNPAGESAPCAAVTVTIPFSAPGVPTNLVATPS